jgi:tetratricopeptide (TPR) repeat protein
MIYRPDTLHIRSFFRAALAASLLTIAACSDPAPEVMPFDRAQLALAESDGLGAEIILREMLADGTSLPEIAALMGEAELQQDQKAEARKWLESGEFSPETRGRGFHMLGRVETLAGNLPAAGEAFDQALKSIPDNPELWVDIGRLRYLGGEHTQAVEASIHAVELDPENPNALQFRAQLVRDAEGVAAALPWYEAALERNPDNLVLMGDYAATLGEFGQAKDMLAVVRRMIDIDEYNPRAFFLQAVLAAQGGEFDLARNLLTRSGDLEREIPAAMMLSGIIDMEKGNYASAAQMFDNLERMQPDNTRIRLLAARSLSLGGNHRELVYRFKDRAMLPGAPPYLATLVGRSYEVLDQRDNAASFLDFAAKQRKAGIRPMPTDTALNVSATRGPQSGRDAVALVRGLISAGQSSAAIANAEAFLRRAPGSGDALALTGDAYFSAGQPGQASDYYARAAAIRQPWPLTRRMIAAEISAGRKQSAKTLLEYHLAGYSANTEATIMLAEAELAAGNPQKAALLLDQAIANGAGRDPHALVLRAGAALELDDLETARSSALRAYSLQRMNRAATAMLAEVLAKTGDTTGQSEALARKAAKLP